MKRLSLLVMIVSLLPWLGQARLAAQAAQHPSDLRKLTAPNPLDFIGSETCSSCHSDLSKGFSSSPHAKLALMHGDKGVTCESCHGPARAHLESGGDPTKILQLSKMSPQKVNATCLGCHATAHPNFERSEHGKAGVSCTSCHSVHKPVEEASLLKLSQPKLCYSCHVDVKPAFSQPFHHKVNEGLLKCSDCHDTHGTFGVNQLRSTADQNMICTKCHSETRGPFAFEHPPVKVEGCLSCHSPHGSQNARLLNVPNINALCIGCHSEISGNAIRGTTPVDTNHNQNGNTVACTNCHAQIHGSNVNQWFLK